MIGLVLAIATACPPPLEPMERTVVVFDGVTVVESVADTPTRLVRATYAHEVVDGTLDCEGAVEATNRRATPSTIRYRHAVAAPPGWKPRQGQDEATGVCGDRRLVVWLVEMEAIPAGETRETPIRWVVPLYRRADINEDGRVDAADQGILLGDWNTDAWRSDLNGDGVVDGADLGEMQGAWNP